MKERKITRRELLERTIASCAACTFVPFLLASGDERIAKVTDAGIEAGTMTFDLTDPAYSPLRKTGGAVYANIEGESQPVIIHRVSESEVAVFSSRCTHAGCKVELPKAGEVVCHCHNSVFDGAGKRLRGPASRDLKRFEARIQQDSIVVNLS
ncbi:MAG: Rieske (2Fe-2S) protein [Spirochaetes bacterium]|nr:Rieske (2Fe-2S) protein [Spirochaetota bacterium]